MEKFNQQPAPKKDKEDKGEPVDMNRRKFLGTMAGLAAVAVAEAGYLVKKETERKELKETEEAKIDRNRELVNSSEIGVVTKKIYNPKTYIDPMDNVNPMRTVDPLFDFRKNMRLASFPERFSIEVKTDTGLIRFDVNEEEFKSIKEGSSIQIEKKTEYETISDKQGNLMSKKIIKDSFIGFKQI